MGSSGVLRGEEHCDHTARAVLRIVGAQGGEVHAVQEVNDLAHGPHLRAPHRRLKTMKCAAFQGVSS